ncbi:ATP/maltotriose-dependent transcriptional regulator MalT [Arthrobacter stackebrandtii]|uniref:ATP/maltotriose-dependent transcriptional regulator MalT n=1 Tax=Arthrobacter stackebrandtii TaxID=272161 RepID=A0ABS4YS03_9MICC|nr:ATP/maltotriose-dependent transcriptional regulator MalT [Arthrobacter stackebrandtii]
MRQGDIEVVQAHLADPLLHGAVILGPRGVGKTALSRNVARRIGSTTHVVNLFGTGVPSDVPYSIFPVQLARLNARQSESPAAILGAMVDQVLQEANGRPIVLNLDDLPGIDTLSMGVLMHLVLSGRAKLLVVARTIADLPEDLAWMLKDGLLAQQRLAPFSRAEVRELLSKALDGPVAEAVVAQLFAFSAGNPLVLQALVHEYLGSGALKSNDGVWVPAGRFGRFSDDVLLELVESRLARESPQLRTYIEKFSLLKEVPLAMAIQVLGADAVTSLEERGFVVIAADRRKTVGFAEPYVGETIRNQMSAQQKGAYFQELSSVLSLDAEDLSPQELLMLASWLNEAGMAMEPEVALAAAQAALQLFDPQLALACANHVPPGHPLAVAAAQKRSRAHHAMAGYSKAATVLENFPPEVLDALTAPEYASWAQDLAVSLVWQPNAMPRIRQILDRTWEKVQQAEGTERAEAEKFYNLARFEVAVNRGEFGKVIHDLKIASKDPSDRSYRLNSSSLLTMALAATGHERDAVELSEAVDAEAARHNVVVRLHDWHLYGRIVALTWSGQWRRAERELQQAIEFSNSSLHYRGGALELSLGIAYASAGRDMEAAEILLCAAAQLEVRDTYTGLELVYSVLACVYARLGDPDHGWRYLAMAKAAGPHVTWVNRTLSDHFQALAALALGDEGAVDRLAELAGAAFADGNATPATAILLSAVTAGAPGQYELLDQMVQNCQGPLATAGRLLARAAVEGSAQAALEAGDRAREMEFTHLERHANELALRLAKAHGDSRLQREAKNRLRGVVPEEQQDLAPGVVPLTPRELQVARLAIRGMGNRDIAAKIGVSVRTVEGHLYQVFAKLGITSRTDLEKWVHL